MGSWIGRVKDGCGQTGSKYLPAGLQTKKDRSAGFLNKGSSF
jgi:hypothetical protein